MDSANDPPAHDAPTGVARRGRRISDAETERRMLDAALAMIDRTGLTVSLEHLSLEDVIRDAGVSRSTVYRRWPYKDLFFSDVVRRLAEAAGAGALSEDTATVELIRDIVEQRLDWLATPDGRQALIAEILRQSGLSNFQFFYRSRQWHSYLALHATFLSLPAGGLRDDVQAALARSEQQVIDQIAASYEHITNLLGYRLRPELGATFETLAQLLNATMRGLVLIAPAVTDIAARRVDAAPFQARERAEWSQPALAFATLVLGFLEPDPDTEWTDERQARTREALQQPRWPTAGR